MNLKEIKKLPFVEFTEESQVRWKVTVREPVVDGERLLVVDFLKNEDCTGYHREEVPFRIVCAKKSQEVKGIDQTGKVTNSVFQKLQRVKHDYIWISEKEEKRLLRFLGISANACENHGISDLCKWVNQTREEQKKRAHMERGELIEEDYRLCPEALPDGLIEFIRREVLPRDNVLVYSKGNVRGLCYQCGETVRANGSNRFVQGARNNCPNCGATVWCVLNGSTRYEADYVDNVIMAQKGTDGETVFFRQWQLRRDPTAKWERIEPFLFEVARYGIRGDKTAKWQREGKESYFARCERYSLEKWTMWNGNCIYDGPYSFCRAGIKDALAGTKMQYADLKGYMKDTIGGRRDAVHFLEYHAQYPVVEFLWKTGYRSIVRERIRGMSRENRNAIYWKRDKLKDCFRFPLRFLKVKHPKDWVLDDVAHMNKLWEQWGDRLKEDEIKRFLKSGINPADLRRAAPYASIGKILNYLEKQLALQEEERKNGPEWQREYDRYRRRWNVQIIAQTYRDYLRECEQLQLGLNDKDVLFPKSLKAAHDRTMAQVKFEASRQEREQFRKEVEKLEKFAWQEGSLFIRPAREADELRAEGKALHHCVGGYVGEMSKGETAIFFVRKANEPDKPYFTLELRKKRVIQCRTEQNQSYEQFPEVKAFVDSWMREVVAKGGKKKAKEAAA